LQVTIANSLGTNSGFYKELSRHITDQKQDIEKAKSIYVAHIKASRTMLVGSDGAEGPDTDILGGVSKMMKDTLLGLEEWKQKLQNDISKLMERQRDE